MKTQIRSLSALTVLFSVLMSIPFLVPHAGWVSLFGLVPLLWMDRIAREKGVRHFWIWHYSAFVLWNALTTFWVCNATVGGGLFAVFANALQMSLVFGLFRWVRKRMGGALPYVFLAAAWIAWERYYLTVAQISWPWLVLGNSFAGTVGLVQWYDVLGTLGGSLWVWASNLALFGTLCAFRDGVWKRWNPKARTALVATLVLVTAGPAVWSLVRGARYEESGDPLNVVIIQPNLDPYHKFVSMTQKEQTGLMEKMVREGLAGSDTTKPVLVLTPETSTNDVTLGSVQFSPTFNRFVSVLGDYPAANILFGASTYEYLPASAPRSYTEYRFQDGRRLRTHNSALIVDRTGRYDLFHKSKLVIGTEMLPYPKVLGPVNEALGHPCATSTGQDEITLLPMRTYGEDGALTGEVPVGCAICYESVYGEYCTGYVRKGARLLAVITNDAWWGNTPGYRQHFNYSRLRAIETRRDVARSANTGISAIIDQKGRVVSRTPWWEPAVLTGQVRLRSEETFFTVHGDIPGRLCVFVFLLLLLAACVRAAKPMNNR